MKMSQIRSEISLQAKLLEEERQKARWWNHMLCYIGLHSWRSAVYATSGRYALACRHCYATKRRITVG